MRKAVDKERGPEEQETNTVENSSVTGEDGVLPAAADVVDVNGSVLLEVRSGFITHLSFTVPLHASYNLSVP